MNLFKLYWSWYEDDQYYLFVHQNKTNEDFDLDCKNLLINYGEEYLSKEESWAGAIRWIEFISEKLPTLGYLPVSPHSYGFFGGYIFDGKHDGNGWKEIVGDSLYEKAVEHNKKIQKELDERISGLDF